MVCTCENPLQLKTFAAEVWQSITRKDACFNLLLHLGCNRVLNMIQYNVHKVQSKRVQTKSSSSVHVLSDKSNFLHMVMKQHYLLYHTFNNGFLQGTLPQKPKLVNLVLAKDFSTQDVDFCRVTTTSSFNVLLAYSDSLVSFQPCLPFQVD